MKRLLLGVGNRLSRDDGAGPVLAERLAGSDWLAIDCGTSLENIGGVVSREMPDLLVIANQTGPVELTFDRTDPWGDIPDMTVIAFADAAGRVASAETETAAEGETDGNG